MRRLRRPTRRQVHLLWLIAATVVAAWLAHGAIPVFMGLFVVVWLFGYLVLERLVRR